MIINCAVKYGRKVALSGRSMVNVMGIASELGYLHIPDGVLIDLNLINRYEPGQLVLITTGSQGEPMSALTRMAFSDHRQVAINPNDFIIISARPIPGNEKTVGAVVNELLKQGCDRHLREHVRRPRLRPRLPGGAEDDAGPDQAQVLHPGPRRAEAPAQARGPGHGHGHAPGEHLHRGHRQRAGALARST